MKEYDLIVIGAGGGIEISSAAAQKGYKVALIEKEKLGGTCLSRGCIPSKMLIYPANLVAQIKEEKKFGITVSGLKVNFSGLVKRISKTVDKESASISPNYDVYAGEAKFVADKVLEIKGKRITAKKIVIAAGARSSIPPLERLKETPFMTSKEALRNTRLPKRLVIIGGGYIGCELGSAYSALGSKVIFIVRDKFLGREDGDIQKEFTKAFAKRHEVHHGNIAKVEYQNKQFTITVKDSKSKLSKVIGDQLLIATGIQPNSDNLGLENTKISKDERGFIKVNKYLETSVPGVYALGDVIGTYMFRHSVNFEAEYLVNSLLLGLRKPIIYPPMPHAIFTNPEIGAVGMTEEQAKEKKLDYVAGISYYKNCAQGLARLSEVGMVKIIADKNKRTILGAHILGDEASTMIHQLTLAMTMNAKVDNLLSMIYVHPALSEVVRNAAKKAIVKLNS